MMDTLFRLSHEHKEARARFGAFCRERVRPGAAQRDRDGVPIPNDLFREAAGHGLVGMTVPREAGGSGCDWWTWGQTLESVAYEGDDSSFPMLLAYRETAANLVFSSRRADLVERYVRPHVRGESFIGWAFTEIDDYFNLQTTAKQVQGGYRVTGFKPAVTGGMGDESFLVYARNEAGTDVRVVLVHRDSPGLTVEPRPTLGLRGLGLASLRLSDVFVPEDRVVVASDGISHAQRFIRDRRLTLAAWATGRLFSLLEKVIDALTPLTRFGERVIQAKSVQMEIGRMVLGIEIIRAVTERMLRDADAQMPLTTLSFSVGKHVGATQAIEVAHIAQKLVGGAGFWQDQGFDRYLRDLYGLLPILGGPIALETELGLRAIEHRAMERRLDER
jgi:alkylation response protein AidB-like acyl-CoA dehydrogenase